MLHKTKSVLIKLLLVLCVMCCAVALAFGLVGCSDESESGKSISSVALENGSLVIYYTDGSSDDLGSVTGSTGATGATGATGVGIASVALNDDGQLVITYTDGTVSDPIDIPVCTCDPSSTCSHEDYDEVMITPASCSDGQQGVYLYVCKDCGTSWVDFVDAEHTWADEAKVVEVTCTEDGYTTYICEVCGQEDEHTNIVEATGHVVEGITITQADIANVAEILGDYEPTYYVSYEDGKTVCDDGGWAVYACEKCDAAVWAYEVGPLGHVVGDDYKLVAPTTAAEGSLTFTCTRCGTYKSVVLPKLVWVTDTVNGTLVTYYEFDTTGSEITYTIVSEEGWCTDDEGDLTISFVYADTTFTFTANIIHYHVLTSDVDGDLANSFFVHNTSLNVNTVYDWDLLKDYATQLVDTTITCKDPSVNNASIKCSVCGDQIYIKVKTSHSTSYDEVKDLATFVVDDEPECEKTGTGHYTCTICNTTVSGIVIPATGHSNYVGYDASISQIDGTLTVKIKCGVCGKYLGTETYESGDYTYTTSGTASCETATDNTYIFEYEGETVTVEEHVEALAHAYVGEDGNLVDIVRDKIYTSDTFGLTVSWQSADQVICQDDDITGTFTCVYCEKNVVVSVKDPHTYEALLTIYIVASEDDKLGDNYLTVEEFAELWANTVGTANIKTGGKIVTATEGAEQLNVNVKYVLATSSACTEESVYYAYCSVCEYWVIETDDALGHRWSYKIIENPTETTEGTITITCAYCGMSITGALPVLTDSVWTYDEDASYAADCSNTGLDVYVSGKITVSDGTNSGTITGVIVEVVLDRTYDHTYGSTIHFTVSEGAYDYHYSASVCEECGNMYDVSLEDTVASQPFQDSDNN